eukprot:7553176-Alexandrium_andersonii.AAC.1
MGGGVSKSTFAPHFPRAQHLAVKRNFGARALRCHFNVAPALGAQTSFEISSSWHMQPLVAEGATSRGKGWKQRSQALHFMCCH